jgi:hypothetical protein
VVPLSRQTLAVLRALHPITGAADTCSRQTSTATTLQRARATVFSLDITDADCHTLEGGLKSASFDTGGFFARTHIFPGYALDQLAEALEGPYVLFAEKPDVDIGVHSLRIRLVKAKGTPEARISSNSPRDC